tara:strand:+ start:4125 stop:4553 length:429 start_codon:yes stop_codon:yes gene_type:complete
MSEEVESKPLETVPETSENSDSSHDEPVVEKEEKKENIEMKVEEEAASPDPKATTSTPKPSKEPEPVPPTPPSSAKPPGPVAPPSPAEQQKVRISDVKINNPNDALNGLAGFVHLAQQRGVYSFEESAKIYECIKMLEDRSR